MQPKLFRQNFLSSLVIVALNWVAVEPAQGQDKEPPSYEAVKIEKKTIRKKNPGYDAEEYGDEGGPWDKFQVIQLPIISGMKSVAVQKKVNQLISPQQLLKDYNDTLNAVDYVVRFNKDHILSLSFTLDTAGATGRGTKELNANMDLRTGELITVGNTFEHANIDELVAHILKLKKTEERKAGEENGLDVKDYEFGNQFTKADLNNFYIGDKGLTFVYPYEIRGSLREGRAPVNHYFLSYEELKPYINRTGPLGIFVKQR